MTTSERITLGVSVAGALGIGALLQAWVTHLLQRREKEISFADRSVQMAETLMARMEMELGRAQEALTKAQRESEELRRDLSTTAAKMGADAAKVAELQRRLQETYVAAAQTAITNAQEDAQQVTRVRRSSRRRDEYAGLDLDQTIEKAKAKMIAGMEGIEREVREAHKRRTAQSPGAWSEGR